MVVPKLSANIAVLARNTISSSSPREKVIRLYRHIQKEIPYILDQYAIDEDVAAVRTNIRREFRKHSASGLDAKIVNMMIFKGQSELDEALAQWKTRTHILKYVYDVVYQPHLARSKQSEVPDFSDMPNLR